MLTGTPPPMRPTRHGQWYMGLGEYLVARRGRADRLRAIGRSIQKALASRTHK